jgi:hypothetical protein
MSSVVFTGLVASGVLTVTSISGTGSSSLITTSMVIISSIGSILGTITSQLSGTANQTGTYQLDNNSTANTITATFSSGGAVNASTFIVSGTPAVLAGQFISGTGIPLNTFVKSVVVSGGNTTVSIVKSDMVTAQLFTVQASGTYTVSPVLQAELKSDALQGQGNFSGWFISTSLPNIYGVNNNSNSTYGEENWVLPGTYYWTVPSGVTSVSMLLIGGGAGGTNTTGGTGGSLSYVNNYTGLTPGSTYSIVVGAGGTAGGGTGGDSYILKSTTQNITATSVSTVGSNSYTTAGSYSFTLPEFVTSIFAQVQGGGGGIAPNPAAAQKSYTKNLLAYQAYYVYGGAGGGGYNDGSISGFSLKSTVNISVGAGGTTGLVPTLTFSGGGYSYSGGSAGGLGGTTTVTASGSSISASGGGGAKLSASEPQATGISIFNGGNGNAASSGGSGLGGSYTTVSGGVNQNASAGGTGKFSGGPGGAAGVQNTSPNSGQTSTFFNPGGTGEDGWSGGGAGHAGAAFVSWNQGTYTTALTLQDVSMLSVGMLISFSANISTTSIVRNTPYWVTYINPTTKVIGLSNSSTNSNSMDFMGNISPVTVTNVTITYTAQKASGGGSVFSSTGLYNFGGAGNTTGGGGAGGYTGAGFAGGSSGSGGGAGGSGNQGGAGIGIYGSDGFSSAAGTSSQGATGGLFGGGGGIGTTGGAGASGAVRIIWGAGRSFPSTNTLPNNTNIGTGKLNLTNTLLLSPSVPNNTQVTGTSGGNVTINTNPTSVGKASFLIGSNSIVNVNSDAFMPGSFTNVHKTFVPTREDLSDLSNSTKQSFVSPKTLLISTRIDIPTDPIVGSSKLIVSKNLNMVLTRTDIDGVDITLEKNIPTSTASSNNPIILIQGDQNLTTNVEDRIGWG